MKMMFREKQIVNIVLMLMCFVSASSCEKIITPQLQTAPPQLVIEGMVSNKTDSAVEVRVSTTKSFGENNDFAGVKNASVFIQENAGETYQLKEDSAGVFHRNLFRGMPGNKYTLTVEVNGATYSAVSIMPSAIVPLDTITAESLVFAGSSTITIYPNYKDPEGKGNSYRLVEYKNGIQVKHVFEQNDDFSDGLIVTRPLINPDGNLARGDTLRVDLQCIDADVYKYWFSLDQAATGENQSATPTNPVSNISGGALGYFSAYSVTSKTIVIP